MRRPPAFTSTLGVAIGVVAALVLFEARSRPSVTLAGGGSMLPETGGSLREIVIQFIANDPVAFPVYQQLLPQLRSDTIVNVLCPDQQAYLEFAKRLGPVSCKIKPIITGHEMTVWSRDRWVAVVRKNPIDSITLFTSTEEDGSAAWPQRAGDARLATDIAKASDRPIDSHHLPLYFDGGDLLATDDRAIFVAPRVLDRNLNRTVASASELTQLLQKHLSGRVILLNQAPDHHVGMYMMSAGNRTMLVADPKLGQAFQGSTTTELPGGNDQSEATQRAFDAVADQVAGEGYHVIRIPTLASPDQKTFLTYVNVLTEQSDGGNIVYLPAYQGAESMNHAASAVWKSLGYDVRPIDCTSSYRYFGNLHCLVNVLRRG